MRFFEWFNKVPTETTPVPSPKLDFETVLFDVLEEDQLKPLNAEIEAAADCPICDMFIHIEYEGVDGETSRRPITIRKQVENRGNVSLIATCHQSNAIKWFRMDRITAVMSVDGQSYRPAAKFWALVGYNGAPSAANCKVNSSAVDATTIKATHKHRIRVLGALAGADGYLHEKEVDAIVAYLSREVKLAGGNLEVNTEGDLAEHIKRIRITRDHLDDSLDFLFSTGGGVLSAEELHRFLEAARLVVDADGLFHSAEFDFLEYLEAEFLEGDWNLVGDTKPQKIP